MPALKIFLWLYQLTLYGQKFWTFEPTFLSSFTAYILAIWRKLGVAVSQEILLNIQSGMPFLQSSYKIQRNKTRQ